MEARSVIAPNGKLKVAHMEGGHTSTPPPQKKILSWLEEEEELHEEEFRDGTVANITLVKAKVALVEERDGDGSNAG